jgi:hypothetical protein
LIQKVDRLLNHGITLHLLLEIPAFCRELVKVAPAAIQADCYLHSAEAMMGLLKMDEAEEFLQEGMAGCRHGGLKHARVSPAPR